jgi:hypothetical protein
MPRRVSPLLPPFGWDSYILPADPVQTARYLIEHVGGVREAQQAVKAAAKKMRREAIAARKAAGREKGGRPPDPNIELWIIEAAKLQQREKLSKTAAFERLADQLCLPYAKAAKKAFVRNLLRKTRGHESIAEFFATKPPRR